MNNTKKIPNIIKLKYGKTNSLKMFWENEKKTKVVYKFQYWIGALVKRGIK